MGGQTRAHQIWSPWGRRGSFIGIHKYSHCRRLTAKSMVWRGRSLPPSTESPIHLGQETPSWQVTSKVSGPSLQQYFGLGTQTSHHWHRSEPSLEILRPESSVALTPESPVCNTGVSGQTKLESSGCFKQPLSKTINAINFANKV